MAQSQSVVLPKWAAWTVATLLSLSFAGGGYWLTALDGSQTDLSHQQLQIREDISSLKRSEGEFLRRLDRLELRLDERLDRMEDKIDRIPKGVMR